MTSPLLWGGAALAAYVYAGYPTAVLVAGRIRRGRFDGGDGDSLPGVSVIIAAHDEEGVIEKKLVNTLELDYPGDRLEVIVAADGSDDDTVAIAERFADRGVSVLHRPERRGKSAALNRAMTRAGGEIVVFSDANNMYEIPTLRRLVAPFANLDVGVVTGAKVVSDGDGRGVGEGLYWRYEDLIKRAESDLGCCTAVAGEVTAVRRSLLEPIPPEIINDDFWMAMRAVRKGARVVYEPRARSIEPPSVDLAAERRRRTRMVAGRFQAMARWRELLSVRQPRVAWQIVSHKFLRPLVPAAMASMALGTILDLRKRPRRVAVAAALVQIGFYGAAACAPRGRSPIGRLLAVPRFLVSSNWASVLGLHAHVTGRATSVWERVDRVVED